MFKLPFLTSPSDWDISSTYFQVLDSGSGIFKLLIISNNIGPGLFPGECQLLLGARQRSSQLT